MSVYSVMIADRCHTLFFSIIYTAVALNCSHTNLCHCSDSCCLVVSPVNFSCVCVIFFNVMLSLPPIKVLSQLHSWWHKWIDFHGKTFLQTLHFNPVDSDWCMTTPSSLMLLLYVMCHHCIYPLVQNMCCYLISMFTSHSLTFTVTIYY